jgi:hypothetical protein
VWYAVDNREVTKTKTNTFATQKCYVYYGKLGHKLIEVLINVFNVFNVPLGVLEALLMKVRSL